MSSDAVEKDLSLVFQGYQAIRGRILRGEYSPGMRLKLDALQHSLGVSSSPLREALNRLVAEGLVEVERDRGFRASQVSAAEFEEITRLRLLLEGDALRRSVELGNDEWEGRVVSASHKLARIEERMAETNSGQMAGMEDWSARHREFHMAMLSNCGARQLQMIGILFDQAERYRRLARLFAQPRKKNLEHRKLQEAVLSRDTATAVALLTAHINKTAERVLRVLQTAQDPRQSVSDD